MVGNFIGCMMVLSWWGLFLTGLIYDSARLIYDSARLIYDSARLIYDSARK